MDNTHDSTRRNQRASIAARLIPVVLVLVVMAFAIRYMLSEGPPVAIVGDSITVVSAGQISDQLDAYEVSTKAVVGATASDMLPAAAELAQKRPEQLVVNLGSNDVRRSFPASQTEADYRTLLAGFPDTQCITFVSINTHMDFGKGVQSKTAGALNVVLLKLASADQRISIVDWNTIVTDDMAAHAGKSTLIDDTVHPNAKGQKVLISAIHDQLKQCH